MFLLKSFCIAVLFFSLLGCESAADRAARENAARNLAKKCAVKEYVASLSDEVKISQLFLVNIVGDKKFTPVEKTGALYGKSGAGEPLLPGGCLLFKYNIASEPDELFDFLTGIKGFYDEFNNVPPFIAVDQEGGDVCRLRKITSPLPSQEYMQNLYNDAAGGVEAVEEVYSSQSRQMKLLGIHMNLAPVVEAVSEANRDFLGSRSFGSMENVIALGKIETDSFEKNGIATVLKHFPGNSNTDPHTGLPEISVTKAELENDYIRPFRELASSSSSILMSHARIHVTDDENADSLTPAGLSKYWVGEVLRKDIGFEGVIFSDDIFMGALNDNGFPPEKAVVMAIEAGVDCIMLSEKKFGQVAGILLEKAKNDPALAQRIDEAAQRVIFLKAGCGILDFVPVEEDVKNYRFTYQVAGKKAKIDRNGVIESFFAEKNQINQKGYLKY